MIFSQIKYKWQNSNIEITMSSMAGNIVSILFCDFNESILLLYTFLVISYSS